MLAIPRACARRSHLQLCSWLSDVYQRLQSQATGFLNLQVTVHSIVPPRRKNSEHTCGTFRPKCPMIVAFSQPHRKCFQDLFRTPTTLQPPSTILLHIRGSLKYNNSFRKTLPWQLLSPYVLPPALACFSLRAARKLITL